MTEPRNTRKVLMHCGLVFVRLPGVAALMGFVQVGDVEPGVAVEGLEAGVPQELLDVVKVGVALDHLGGAASPVGDEGRQLKQ